MGFDFSDAMSVASSGMKAQANRLRHVSENIANTDTPGLHKGRLSWVTSTLIKVN
jgi:flagellar basal-body rod protein FlgC